MNSIDVNEATGYVNKIIDSVRCANCHKLEGFRVRYPCGHSACDECVVYADSCQICGSPSQRFISPPKPDIPLSLTVKNAVDLQKAYQSLNKTYNEEIHRKRISENLRIEKEIFPNCIQAPLKYENKRKSSYKNKENKNSTFFPGEAVASPIDKMENKVTYVHQWLSKNEKIVRKPFADLRVNTQWPNNPTKKNVGQNIHDENFPLSANRKRSHFKTTDTKTYSSLGGNRKIVNECDNTPKKIKKKSVFCTSTSSSDIQKKSNNDESGFIDDDPIVIDDSQELVIDKDKDACLAVLKAHKDDNFKSTSVVNSTHVNNTNASFKQLIKSSHLENEKYFSKVPFFKKSAIIETCRSCKNDMNSEKPVPIIDQFKPVTITIDCDNLLTTITVFKDVQNNVEINTSNNVSVQTDLSQTESDNGICLEDYNCTQVNVCNDEMNRCHDGAPAPNEEVNICDGQSEDLFTDDRKIFEDIGQSSGAGKCVVIEESDSDTDLDASGPMSVKVDVHRSCEKSEYGVLSDVVNVREHELKPRRRPRGHSPTSTDSSDKENFNPNRSRRGITKKKKTAKK